MSATAPRVLQIALTLTACAALAACGTFDSATERMAGIVGPYKAEVVQGNFVSKEQVQQLQRGMTKQQVREVLGSPLVTSVFHGNRWEYVFTLARQSLAPQRRSLTLHFTGDQLDRFEGDEMPTEAEFVASIGSNRLTGRVPTLEVPEGVLRDFASKQPAPSPTKVAADSPVSTTASYPALEAGPPRSDPSAWSGARWVQPRPAAPAASGAPTP